jgi:hypothetical protein
MLSTRSPLIIVAVALSLGLAACGVDKHMERVDNNTNRMASELEADRTYIRSLTDQIKLLADSLAALEKLSETAFEAVVASVARHSPPGKTPDIDDVLKGETAPTQQETPSK